jgi:uncharacterized membrane protein
MISANEDLRLNARMQLTGNWRTPIIVTFLHMLLTSAVSAIPKVGGFITLFISGPLYVGACMYFLRFSRDEKPDYNVLFLGFNRYVKTTGLYLWNALWISLWMLLLIVPGVIKAISYSMSFYIMADNPEVGIKEAVNISKRITMGYKSKIFSLGVSFIGWALLSALTLGVGFLWLGPYVQTTMAHFYAELKAEAVANGIFEDTVTQDPA